METSARHYKGISGYCMAAVPKMSFNFVPLVHPNDRGCGKSVQKGGHHGHILAGPGEGMALHLPPPPSRLITPARSASSANLRL
jgi:hypothetical protein